MKHIAKEFFLSSIVAAVSLVPFTAIPQSTAKLESLNLSALPSGWQKQLKSLVYIPPEEFATNTFSGTDSIIISRPGTSSAGNFYVSPVEVTNKEYREFTNWVIDSLAHSLLGHYSPSTSLIDWSKKINWRDQRLNPLLIQINSANHGRREIDPDKILYFDVQNKRAVRVFPDTAAWFLHSSFPYITAMAKQYFRHPFFNNYPVVGVSQWQAIAFCNWKTHQLKAVLPKGILSNYEITFRLPSNNEWEAAAKTPAHMLAKSARSLRNKGLPFIFLDGPDPGRGEQLLTITEPPFLYDSLAIAANFGSVMDHTGFISKTFADDGFYFTAPVNKYPSNYYGVYNLRGNVAEWLIESLETVSNENGGVKNCLHPYISEKFKDRQLKDLALTKGGSWISSPFYLQRGTFEIFALTESTAYIGFRYIVQVTKK